jgi:hypothetical protein
VAILMVGYSSGTILVALGSATRPECRIIVFSDEAAMGDRDRQVSKLVKNVAKKRPEKEEDENARMKRIMAICSGC